MCTFSVLAPILQTLQVQTPNNVIGMQLFFSEPRIVGTTDGGKTDGMDTDSRRCTAESTELLREDGDSDVTISL